MVTYRHGGRNETEIEIDDTHNLREIAIFFLRTWIRRRLYFVLSSVLTPRRRFLRVASEGERKTGKEEGNSGDGGGGSGE